MRCIGFPEIRTVVPEGVATIGRTCLDDTIADGTKCSSLGRTGEGRGHKRCFGIEILGTAFIATALSISGDFIMSVSMRRLAEATNKCAAKVLHICCIFRHRASNRRFVADTGNHFSRTRWSGCPRNIKILCR